MDRTRCGLATPDRTPRDSWRVVSDGLGTWGPVETPLRGGPSGPTEPEVPILVSARVSDLFWGGCHGFVVSGAEGPRRHVSPKKSKSKTSAPEENHPHRSCGSPTHGRVHPISTSNDNSTDIYHWTHRGRRTVGKEGCEVRLSGEGDQGK